MMQRWQTLNVGFYQGIGNQSFLLILIVGHQSKGMLMQGHKLTGQATPYTIHDGETSSSLAANPTRYGAPANLAAAPPAQQGPPPHSPPAIITVQTLIQPSQSGLAPCCSSP
jgi:hypothetical protein